MKLTENLALFQKSKDFLRPVMLQEVKYTIYAYPEEYKLKMYAEIASGMEIVARNLRSDTNMSIVRPLRPTPTSNRVCTPDADYLIVGKCDRVVEQPKIRRDHKHRNARLTGLGEPTADHAAFDATPGDWQRSADASVPSLGVTHDVTEWFGEIEARLSWQTEHPFPNCVALHLVRTCSDTGHPRIQEGPGRRRHLGCGRPHLCVRSAISKAARPGSAANTPNASLP
jgi:hypothetical protein